MLSKDCEAFVAHIRSRDPVVITHRDSSSPAVEEVTSAWEHAGTYCLWNQALLPTLQRKFIPEATIGPYYRVDSDLPVIEFSYPNPVEEQWNNRPALTQGRVWAEFAGKDNRAFEQWYDAVVRWIRKNFVRNPIPHLGGYVGPAAYEWYKGGGLLLPFFLPPITPQWLSWVEAQDQHRSVFARS
ncbi:MAG TPA: hypothetical protein VF133_16480 [Terriglobales bacterium]